MGNDGGFNWFNSRKSSHVWPEKWLGRNGRSEAIVDSVGEHGQEH